MFHPTGTQSRGSRIKDKDAFSKTHGQIHRRAFAPSSLWTLSGLVLAACSGGGGGGDDDTAPVAGSVGYTASDSRFPDFTIEIGDSDSGSESVYAAVSGDINVTYEDTGVPAEGGAYSFVTSEGVLLSSGRTGFGTITWEDADAQAAGEWTYTPDVARIEAYFADGGYTTRDFFRILYTGNEGEGEPMIRLYSVRLTAPVEPPPDAEPAPELPDILPTPAVAGQYIRYHTPAGDDGLPGGFYFFTDDGDGNPDNDVASTPVNLQSVSVLAGNDRFLLDGEITRDLDSTAGRDPNAAPSLTGGGGDDVYEVDLQSITRHTPEIVIADVDVSSAAGAQNLLVFTGYMGVDIAGVEVENRDSENNFAIRFYNDRIARADANEVAVVNIAFQAVPDFDIYYDGVLYGNLDAVDAAALETALAADIA